MATYIGILHPSKEDLPHSKMAGFHGMRIEVRNGDRESVAAFDSGSSREKTLQWVSEQRAKGENRATNGATSRAVNGYSIIASRGELSRNNCALPSKSASVGRAIHADQQNFVDFTGAKRKLRSSKESARPTAAAPLSKSASVPAILKVFSSKDKPSPLTRASDEGILKRSSTFLTSLAHCQSALRLNERSCDVNRNHLSAPRGVKYSTFKGYFSLSSATRYELRPPSLETLHTAEWRKKNRRSAVKKSVSFSSDTSFEEKRSSLKKATVHEAKVYYKGVLQDCGNRESTVETKVPTSWESPPEGPRALLRAAMNADDVLLKEIVTKARNMSATDVDVNLADSSGRTAISYMAGNGAAEMLELALSLEGANPNLPDNEGNTPLHFAAQAGQTECLNVLLQRCPTIEVDARNTLGFTPLMKAALQGRTKCAKILLFAGANPTLRDYGRGLRAEQWARFCGRYVCAEVIERFARHRLLERTTSCRWGSEPELAAKVLQGKVTPIPTTPLPTQSTGLKSRIRKVFRTSSGPDRSFSLVSQLTSAALCASSPALPKNGQVPPVVKSLLRPLSVPQLRVTLVTPQDFLDKSVGEKYVANFSEKIESSMVKPPRVKKKNK